MRIGTILDQVDLGAMALPEFQRGYVWNRPQVRGLMHSLYRRHPVGSLLIWKTRSDAAHHRGEAPVQPGFVSLLLDGQQRVSSLYGLFRGEPPPFFEGNAQSFSDLRFNLEDETFEFFAPVKMRSDPSWIDVTAVLRDGPQAVTGELTQRFAQEPAKLGDYIARVQQLYTISEIELHNEELTGEDKTLEVVVDIFNRVNSGGTKLSKGDLALAKICAQWPAARGEMHAQIEHWRSAGFDFGLDWLLRNLNAIVTGRAEFSALADRPVEDVQEGLARTRRAVDTSLNLLGARLGLDHHRVLGARAALPVFSRLLSDREFGLRDSSETDRLLYWYVHCSLWGRYAGSTETVLNQDLEMLRERSEDPVAGLIEDLERSRGDLRIRANDFVGWSVGARFYPLLYLLTRVLHARDWGSGIELQQSLLGAHASLELHHIFPKARLYEYGYERPEVNALANFTFLTMETNREITDRDPLEYLPAFEKRHPGALESHWLPLDRDLWRIENYPAFLEARRELLADAANRFLDALLQGEADGLAVDAMVAIDPAASGADNEEALIAELNEWVVGLGLARGEADFELVDDATGKLDARLDVAWPDGLQMGLTAPVALLIDQGPRAEEAAGRHGYRFFTDADRFRRYVETEVLDTSEGVVRNLAVDAA